ncbi:MAG: hypothetical protein RJA67_77 [Bacteroidota bacterium]|jgi:uncharacterized protein (DUF1800 family)
MENKISDQAKKSSNIFDAYESFKNDNFDLQGLLKSRQKTVEVRKTLRKYEGPFDVKEKRHLLNRALVGNASRHMKDLDGLTLDKAINLIFTHHPITQPVNDYYHDFNAEEYEKKYKSKDVGPKEFFISKPTNAAYANVMYEVVGAERIQALYTWVHSEMYHQPTSIDWKLFLFQHNLTPISLFGNYKYNYHYIKMLYEGTNKNYKEFIYDLTISPLMLDYLNLQFSKKEAPDENYAREVQELFTVGKRPFSKFTEKDVREAARLLCGWYYDEREDVFKEGYLPVGKFSPDNHDSGDKVFSAFYSNTVIKGRTGEAGKEELTDFLNMIFATEESAIYLSRRLVQFFVYPVLSDFVEAEIIRPLAKIMITNSFNLSETLKVLLQSEFFFAEEFQGSMIKSPYDYTFSIFKELDIINGDVVRLNNSQFTGSQFIEDKNTFSPKFFAYDYKASIALGDWLRYHFLNSQGMMLLAAPNVAGWAAYYQEPVYDLIWINSDSITQKKGQIDQIAGSGRSFSDNESLRVNLYSLLKNSKEPENINSFINELSGRFLKDPLTESTFLRIKKSVLGEGFPDYYWTSAVNAYLANPQKDNYNTVYVRVMHILNQILMLNEIHIY